MIDLYQHKYYKEFLQEYIKTFKKVGITAELAKAAGCDRTYFSQMLNSKVQLTPDHAYGLCEYFEFNEDQEEYFLLLVLKDRASSPAFAKRLEKKIAMLQEKKLNLSHQLKGRADKLPMQQMALYYSDWLYGAVHILTAVSEYQTPSAMAEKLNLKPAIIQRILKDLLSMNLVKAEGSRFVHSGKNIHVPDDSPFNRQNHFNWRMKAMSHIHEREGVHYSSTFAISKSDYPALKKQLLSFIDEQRKKISNSGSEETFCFCSDLFKL